MQTFISILRGINVSGQKKIIMADLKKILVNLNFREVTTYIQSGNVSFKCNKNLSSLRLANIIETAIENEYHFNVPVFIRKESEIEEIIQKNPFLKDKNINTEKLYVTFLSTAPDETDLMEIRNAEYTPDRFVINNKEVYLYIPQGYNDTKLSNKFFENKLKVAATTRNWKTVNKLFQMTKS